MDCGILAIYLHKVCFLPRYEEIIGVLVNDLTMACNYSKQEQIDLIYTYGTANQCIREAICLL